MAQSYREEAVLEQGCSIFVDVLPLMSTVAGSAGYPVGQSYDSGHGMINLDVRTLSGEEFRLRVESSTRGSEVRKMVLDILPIRSGGKLVFNLVRHQTSALNSFSFFSIALPPFYHLFMPAHQRGVEETVRLKLHQTLQEQGLAEEETAILFCTYVPTHVQAAWCFLMRFENSEAELSLVEGVTHLTAPSNLCRFHLSKSLISLKSLTLGNDFNKSLELVTLPSRLQSLTFGDGTHVYLWK